jgi:hypothetical protein
MGDFVSMGLAAFGALLILVGFWAVLRLLRIDRLARRRGVAARLANRKAASKAAPTPASAAAHPAGTAAESPAPPEPRNRERVVCLVSRHDKVIQSPIAGVYINLGKCFEDLGFQVQRAATLPDLAASLKAGVPGVMAVDCRLGPRTLREIARLARQYPRMRRCVFLFYNAERPEALTPPAILPHAHFLGLAFASQQVMEILAPAFEFEAVAGTESGEAVEAGDGGDGAAKESGAIFEGILSENSLPEILQFLEIGKRTGLLSLEAEQPAGVINFVAGDIVSAQTHSHEGVEAVYEMLALTRGKFRFFPGRVTGRLDVRWSVTQVLMQWAQRVDETGEMVAREEGRSLLDTFG